ncbi:hypothetical protein Aduo_009526 [Ancylostoma duodenale]
MRTLLCLLFIISLWRTESKSDVYDPETCGLPSEEFTKAQKKGIEEPAQEVAAHPVQNAAAHEANDDDYSDDYEVDDEPDDMEDDPNDPMRTKVMGGVRALRGELPWAAIIDLSYLNKVCGGTLISKRHVITAAHCFWKDSDKNTSCNTDDMVPNDIVRKNLKVVVGATCTMPDSETNCTDEDVGTRIGVKRLIFEEFYKRGCSGTKDFAIIELLHDVPKGVHHVCLPHLHDVDELDDPSLRVSSFGWGSDPLNNYENETTPFLQRVDLGVKMTKEECNRMNENVLKGDTFCTFEQPERNVCHVSFI